MKPRCLWQRQYLFDLDMPGPKDKLAKAELAGAIQDIIYVRTLSQSDAAKIMGIDQSKVLKIMRGRLSEFSKVRLLYFLIHMGWT